MKYSVYCFFLIMVFLCPLNGCKPKSPRPVYVPSVCSQPDKSEARRFLDEKSPYGEEDKHFYFAKGLICESAVWTLELPTEGDFAVNLYSGQQPLEFWLTNNQDEIISEKLRNTSSLDKSDYLDFPKSYADSFTLETEIQRGSYSIHLYNPYHEKTTTGKEIPYVIQAMFSPFCPNEDQLISLPLDQPTSKIICRNNRWQIMIPKSGFLFVSFTDEEPNLSYIIERDDTELGVPDIRQIRVSKGTYIINVTNKTYLQSPQKEWMEEYCIKAQFKAIEKKTEPPKPEQFSSGPSNEKDNSIPERPKEPPEIPDPNDIGLITEDKDIEIRFNPDKPQIIAFTPIVNGDLAIYFRDMAGMAPALFGNRDFAEKNINPLQPMYQTVDIPGKYSVNEGRTYFIRIEPVNNVERNGSLRIEFVTY